MCDKKITKESFKVNYSIVNNYIFHEDISDSDNKKYIVSYLANPHKYILIIGDYKHIYPQVFVICKFKNNNLTSHVPKLKTYGKVDKTFTKKFPLKKTDDLYFYIIDKINGENFKNTIIYQLIDIYHFKQLMKDFLKFFSKSNKKIGYLNYNLKGNTLVFEQRENKNLKLSFSGYEHALVNGSSNLDSFMNSFEKMKYTFTKIFYQNPFMLKTVSKLGDKNIKGTEFNRNLDPADRSILKIKYNSNGNYDIMCILRLINTTERILNNIPKQITLSQDQIDFFNSEVPLGDKLDFLLKFSYFKSYN